MNSSDPRGPAPYDGEKTSLAFEGGMEPVRETSGARSPARARVQLPVEATSSCAKPVAVLASCCSRATPVLTVFFSTAPATPPAAEAH